MKLPEKFGKWLAAVITAPHHFYILYKHLHQDAAPSASTPQKQPWPQHRHHTCPTNCTAHCKPQLSPYSHMKLRHRLTSHLQSTQQSAMVSRTAPASLSPGHLSPSHHHRLSPMFTSQTSYPAVAEQLLRPQPAALVTPNGGRQAW